MGLGLAFCPLARAGQSVKLAWNPISSSIVAGYMVNYGTNAANYSNQADAGTNTSLTVAGLQGGTTNYFAVAAYTANHSEGPLSSPIVYVVPKTNSSIGAPALAVVPNQIVNVGCNLIITNTAIETNVPARQVTFSLGAGAPSGSFISANGIFQWAPVREQGSTTNLVTVWAIDNGKPALSNAVSFYVTVGACVQVTIGSSAVLIGNQTSVPVSLYSTVSLTNLSFTLAAPAGRFANWGAAAGNSGLAAAAMQTSNPSLPQFSFAAQSGKTLLGASTLGTISLQSLSTGASAFAPLTVNSIAATASDGTQPGSVSGISGRVTLIANEPLLDVSLTNGATPVLTLYGAPGSHYSVMSATSFSSPINWTTFTNFTLTTLAQSITPAPGANRLEIYRAARF